MRSPFRPFVRLFRLPVRSSEDARAEVDEELAFHLEMAIRERVEEGEMDPEEARLAVLREFGDLEGTRAYCAGMTTWRAREEVWTMRMEQIAQDFRHGLRTLGRSPGFTIVVVATLALGIAANTIVFSLLNPFFVRELPFGDPDELVQVHQIDAVDGWSQDRHSLAQFQDWRDRGRSLSAAAVYQYTDVNVTGAEGVERSMLARMSGEMWDVLGVQAALGRTFGPREAGPGGRDVVVLDHRFWTRRYGADPGVLGRTIELDGVDHTVIGVMPPDFLFPFPEVKVWTPVRASALQEDRGRNGYIMVARLAEGWTIPRAREELARIQRDLMREHPETDQGFSGVNILPIRQALNFAWDELRRGFLVMVVAMGFVLVLACVNVASLTLGRVTERVRELAVRAALGAGRGRLVRHLLAESFILALGGGVTGVLLSYLALGALGPILPEGLYRVGGFTLDGGVLLFAAAVSLATPLLFALPPALRVAGRDLNRALKEGTPGEGTGALTGRRILVVAQVALGMVLLSGAGLMIRSFMEAEVMDLGYEVDGVLTVEATLPAEGYPQDEDVAHFYREATDRARAIAGVQRVASVYPLPLNHETLTTSFQIGGSGTPREEWPVAEWFRVSDDYFSALDIRLLAGRGFEPEDADDENPVVVVSRTLAQRHWNGQSPVGRTLVYGRSGQTVEALVVGVVEDVVHGSLTRGSRPQLYLPMSRSHLRRRFLVLRTGGEPGTVAGPVRSTLGQIDPDLPVTLRPFRSVVRESTLQWAGPSGALGAFGLVALLLAALGVYGVISCWVTGRNREIAIRLALGAGGGVVRREVVGQGVRLTAVGVGIGLLLAAITGRVMGSFLLEVSPLDPVTLGGVAGVFLAVAGAASLGPALRASRVDPSVALREG